MTQAKAAELVASTVNEQLLDRAIRHQIYIQQYGAGVAEDIVKELVQAEQELLGKVAARLVKAEKIGFDRGPWTTKRLSTITAGLGEIVDNKYSATYKGMLKPKMLELAKAEADFTVAGFDSTVPVKLEYELPSPEMLRSMVLSEPFEGAVMGKWWQGVATGEKEKIQRALRQGLVQGETTPQIVRRLTGPKGALAISHHHATAVIRTATNHVSSGARAQTYQQNSKYIKSEKIVATLDARTSEICRFQDGRTYPVGEGPRPPFHFNCRTTVIAVLKSWKELGIPLKEAPPGTRASMNGQVPADLTYKQWFKAQPSSFQKELLGPNRYKMYAAGLEDVTKYASPAGKLYTLKQLYARHPDVALKAKLIEPGQASAALKHQAAKQFDNALDSAVKSLKVPAEASDYPSFLSAYKAAKATISEAAVKAQANGVLAGAKTFAAFDKLKDISKVYKAQIETDNTAKQLQDIAKVTGIKKWQWSTKDNLSTLMTSLDDDLTDAATTQMNDKWLAWKAKQAANQAAKKADAIAIKNATEAVAEIQDSVQLPDSPASWESFKESIEIGQKKTAQLIVDMMEAKVSTDKINEIINPLDLALKTNKDAFKSMVSALKAKELATLAKDTGIKKWQWTTKDEFITLMTSTDASELADVAKNVEAKWLGWKAQQKANQDAKKVIKDKLKADAKELQAAIKAAGGKGLLKDIKVYLGSLESTDDALVGDFATYMWKVPDPDAIKDKLKSMGYKWQNMPEAQAPAKIPPAQAAKELVAMDDFPVAQASSFDWEATINALDNPGTLAYNDIDKTLDIGLGAASDPLLIAKMKQKLAGMGYKWKDPDFDFDAAAAADAAATPVPPAATGPLSQHDQFVGSLKTTNEALSATKGSYPESLHSLGDWDDPVAFDLMVQALEVDAAQSGLSGVFATADDFAKWLVNHKNIHPDLHPVIAHALKKAGVKSSSGAVEGVSMLDELSHVFGKPKDFLSGPKLKQFIAQIDDFDPAAPPVAPPVAAAAADIDLPKDFSESVIVSKKFTPGKAAINKIAEDQNLVDKFGDAGAWSKTNLHKLVVNLENGTIKTELDLMNWLIDSHGAKEQWHPFLAHALKEAGLKHPLIKSLARKAKNQGWIDQIDGAIAKGAAPLPSPVATPPPAPVAATAASEPALAATAAKPKPTAGWTAADDAWEQISPDDFKYLGDASSLGGAHSKDFYELDGDKWLFKPVSKGGWAGGDEFIARGEEAVYKLQRLIDPQTPEVRFIELNGRPGSIQRILPNIDKDFNGISPRELSADMIEQFQREHVLDWLTSNHDGHWKQFLLDPDGHVYGIDKGQAYKFLDSDKLDLTYAPNSHLGEREPYYNEIFRAAKAGEVSFDPQATLKYIERIEELDDDTFREILRPYAEGRFNKKTESDRFLDLALDRKHNLRSDFRDYYRNVTNDPDFDWDAAPPAVERYLGAAETKIVDDVEKMGWQGQTLPFDGDQVEDQNLLIFADKLGDELRTNVKLKLRPDAEQKMFDFIEANGGVVSRAAAQKTVKRVGSPLPEDEFWPDLKAALITINKHVNDGDFKYNQNTLQKAKALRQRLTALSASPDPDTAAMGKEYLAILDEIDKAAVANTKIVGPVNGHYEQYAAKYPPVDDSAGDALAGATPTNVRSVTSGEVTMARRTTGDDGSLVAEAKTVYKGPEKGNVVDDRQTYRQMNFAVGEGYQYTIEYDDGTKIFYRPWSSPATSNNYTVRGEVEIVIPERPSSKVVDDVFAKLDEIGLDARVATPVDAELMYLQKQAYVSRLDETVEWVDMMNDLDARNASKVERITAMREEWQKVLKVDDLTKVPQYNPEGWYERHMLGWKGGQRQAGGNRLQYRFDLKEDFQDVARGGMKDYTLVHHQTLGGDTDQRILSLFENANVLDRNATIISTNEKLRTGVPLSMTSVESDFSTGGANYVFTRIRPKSMYERSSPATGMYFKTRNLRRLDAISYHTDLYGDVGGDKGEKVVRQYRAGGISSTGKYKSPTADWKKFSSKSDNETIFKNGLSIIEELERLVVETESTRLRLIEIFKKANYGTLPDGRKIEDVIFSGGTPNKIN